MYRSDTTESFEGGSLGNWANASTNTLDWIINTGGTTSGSLVHQLFDGSITFTLKHQAR